MKLSSTALKAFLDEKASYYNQPGFIENDPVSIPHSFSKRQDIEIAGLFAAVLAWGKRSTIIRKCRELLTMMDNDPHRFILDHRPADLRSIQNFKHRTFNGTDTLCFIESLKSMYSQRDSLEHFFMIPRSEKTIESGLRNFHDQFFSLQDLPDRTRKHLATPARKSTCKRMNMYLRWMVRKDDKGVDFGIWDQISTSKLVCPLDLHVERVARKLKLVQRSQTDWLTAIELTGRLREFDPIDPVKYDFALFGMGIDEGFGKPLRL